MTKTGSDRATGLATLVAATALMLAAAPPAAAQPPAPRLAPGEYVTERGWGTLSLSAEAGGAMTFQIEAVGGNAHSCFVEGEVRRGKATLEGLDEKTPCVITMKALPSGIDVSSNGCSLYCGVRAQFDGVYLKPPKGCQAHEVEAARQAFKKQYDAKAYADARRTLEPVLGTCGPVLGWLTTGWIRNDLAVTLHKLGDLEGCRTLLAPLAEDAALTDKELLDRYPPSDAESYQPIVRAARTNLRLCRAK